jgi:hypothetical protein
MNGPISNSCQNGGSFGSMEAAGNGRWLRVRGVTMGVSVWAGRLAEGSEAYKT